MKLTPLKGADAVPFGTPSADLLARLGPPDSKQSLGDQEGYPRSREVHNYGNMGYLVADEMGVISVDVNTDTIPVELWGRTINKLSPTELETYLNNNHCNATVTPPDGWGDQSVESLANGLIASYSDDTCALNCTQPRGNHPTHSAASHNDALKLCVTPNFQIKVARHNPVIVSVIRLT